MVKTRKKLNNILKVWKDKGLGCNSETKDLPRMLILSPAMCTYTHKRNWAVILVMGLYSFVLWPAPWPIFLSLFSKGAFYLDRSCKNFYSDYHGIVILIMLFMAEYVIISIFLSLSGNQQRLQEELEERGKNLLLEK